MPWTKDHIPWLTKTGESLKSSDGKPIEIWEFKHQADTKILTSWAKHFRNHYCLDDHIDILRKGTGMSRSEFLNNIKFPDGPGGNKIGPGIRSGDFGEILISDYLQYILSFWVPRTTRYSDKNIRNESEKGCDIIGFKMLKSKESPSDALAVFEAKAQFSGRKANPRLQDAVDGSAKDWIRLAESLSAIKQRLLEQQKLQEADTVERFQNFNDRPYKPMWGAAALFDTSVYDPEIISKTSTKSHPAAKNVALVVIRGESMMPLVHQLYERAANEA